MLRRAVALAHELELTAIDFHRTYSNLSTCLHACGDLEEAVAVAMEGVEWARGRGLWRLQGSFLEANAAASMVELGRWSEAQGLLDRRERPHDRRGGAAKPRGRGRAIGGADRSAGGGTKPPLGRAEGVAGLRDAQFTGPIYGGLVELAIAEGRYGDAETLADEAVERMAGAETLGTRYGVELQGLALHADALAVADARARRDGEAEAAARRDAAERIAAIRAAATEPAGPANGLAAEVLGFTAIAEAEIRQLEARPDPSRVGRGGTGLGPSRATVAAGPLPPRRSRGDARDAWSRADAAERLIEAHTIARRLGAAPLQAACRHSPGWPASTCPGRPPMATRARPSRSPPPNRPARRRSG